MRALVAALALFVSLPAVADPVPREVLAGTYENCARTNPNSQQHKSFCWCVASSIGSDISYQSLMTIDGEMKTAIDRGQRFEVAARSVPEYWRIIQTCRVSSGMGRLP